MSKKKQDDGKLRLYAVRNKEGKWFRRKGYGGYGETWVEDFKQARIYTRIGHARAISSFFFSRWPEYGTPDLVELVIGETNVIDETPRVEKEKAARERAAAREEEAYRLRQVEQAQRQLEEAQKRLAQLGAGKTK